MAEWLTFAAKGEQASDGSSNASIAGFICADGTVNQAPPQLELQGGALTKAAAVTVSLRARITPTSRSTAAPCYHPGRSAPRSSPTAAAWSPATATRRWPPPWPVWPTPRFGCGTRASAASRSSCCWPTSTVRHATSPSTSSYRAVRSILSRPFSVVFVPQTPVVFFRPVFCWLMLGLFLAERRVVVGVNFTEVRFPSVFLLFLLTVFPTEFGLFWCTGPRAPALPDGPGRI